MAALGSEGRHSVSTWDVTCGEGLQPGMILSPEDRDVSWLHLPPLPGHIPSGNLKACIVTWIEAPPASSWKETAVSPAEEPTQMFVHSIILSCSSSQRLQWTFQTLSLRLLQSRIQSGNFSILRTDSPFDEHRLLHQEELAISDLTDLLVGV